MYSVVSFSSKGKRTIGFFSNEEDAYSRLSDIKNKYKESYYIIIHGVKKLIVGKRQFKVIND